MNQKQTQCKQMIYCAKVYEARLKVLAYMQAEDVIKAQEALNKWAEIVKPPPCRARFADTPFRAVMADDLYCPTRA